VSLSTLVCSPLFQESDSDGRSVAFVVCDVTSWDDQLRMFKRAINDSPSKTVDIVIANAGISGPDELFNIEGKITTIPGRR